MPLATDAESCREYARNAGMDDPDRAWISTPQDSWERNPFYSGPPVPHPEDDTELYDLLHQRDMIAAQDNLEVAGPRYNSFYTVPVTDDGEIPF